MLKDNEPQDKVKSLKIYQNVSAEIDAKSFIKAKKNFNDQVCHSQHN